MQEHTAFGNNVYQGTLNPMWPQCLVAQQLLVQFFPRSLKETYIQPAVLTLLKFTQTDVFFWQFYTLFTRLTNPFHSFNDMFLYLKNFYYFLLIKVKFSGYIRKKWIASSPSEALRDFFCFKFCIHTFLVSSQTQFYCFTPRILCTF